MECSGSHRSGLLTAGGVLSIAGGALEVVGAGTGVAAAVSALMWSPEHPVTGVPSMAGVSSEHVILGLPIFLGIAAFGVALGVVAIVGGVSALRRRSFGLSLAGAICALPSGFFGAVAISFVPLAAGNYALASVILGNLAMILAILAIIFMSLSKKEFGAQRKENGV